MALKEGIAKLGGKIPPTWKNPLRDGDTERPDNPEYAGHMFVNANSDNRPGIVDVNLNPIIEKEDLLRVLWPGVDQLLRFQHEWQQRRCLRAEQPPEVG